MARFIVKNTHTEKDTCFNKIGLFSHNIDKILGSIVKHNWGTRLFTLRERQPSLWLFITFASQSRSQNYNKQIYVICNCWEDETSSKSIHSIQHVIVCGVGSAHNRITSLKECMTYGLSGALHGKFLGIFGQDPSDSKSNRLHVDIFQCCFIHLRYILHIPLKCLVIILKSWTSTGFFSNSTSSSVRNCWFSPSINWEIH